MKNKLVLIILNLLIVSLGISQISSGGEPISRKFLENQNIKSVILAPVSQAWITEAAETDGKNGDIERVAKNIPTNLNPYNSGTWETLLNGDRLWRLQITATDALGVNAIFKDFSLAKGSKLFIYSPAYKQVIGAFNETNNHVSKQFSTEIIFGTTLILEYLEPKNQVNKGFFTIENIGSFYKNVDLPIQADNSFGDADPCEINVNCSPEGTNWQDEKRGVARILVMSSQGQGWCTGTLINNTNADCKPYFLTAYHCGNNSSTTNFNNWLFYFNFEFSGCSSSNTSPSTSQTMTGALVRARSNDLNSSTISSDFLLLELNQNVPTTYNPYYNGWNNLNTAPNGGVGIHHPAGDVKKISTFTATPSTVGVTWSNSGQGYSIQNTGTTHWSHAWAATTNGHGVTEGGSSGSPLFNNTGEVIGTLTGGGSYCTQNTNSDQYGKMSYHWESNGTANNRQLKPWLDPTNSGVSSLVGTNPPCTTVATDDAGITLINGPIGIVCGTIISPIIELKNFGTNTLTSVTINYQINTGTLQSYSWTGSLAQNATTIITLPNMTSPGGLNNFTATTDLPNGNTDSNNANNSTTENYTLNTVNNLPVQESFESNTFPPTNWVLSNPDNDKTWEHSTTIGTGVGTKSMFIDNWDYNAPNQLDWFVSETYDFSTVTNPSLTYDLAYAYYDQTGGASVGYDTLGIAASTDCGASFFWIWKQGGTQLATAGGLGIEFIPTATDWQNKILDLTSLIGENSVQFAFIAKNAYGNNLYVDNINISNVAAITLPVAEFTASSTSICIGESITFTDQSTNTPTSWAWDFGGATLNSSVQNPTATFNTAGNYTVSLTVTNADGSDSEIKTNYIIINPDPVIGSFTNSNLLCYNDNLGGIEVNMSSGQTPYLYSMNNGANTNSNTFNNLSAGNYSFLVSDSNGCTTINNTSISQPTILTLNASNLSSDYCNNNNGGVTLNATGGASDYMFSIDGIVQDLSVFGNLAGGNYNATVQDANNCISGINITINNINETFTPTIQTTNTSCGSVNGTAIATVNGTANGYTFLWDNTQTTPTATGLNIGTHTVMLTNSNGCSETTTFNIGNTNAPLVSVQTNDILCNGQTTGSAIAIFSGGNPPYALDWSFGGNSLAVTSTIANLDPGNYTLTVIDNSGCQTSVAFNITEPPVLSINFTKNDEHCFNADGEIEAIVSGGEMPYEYTWNNLAIGNNGIATGIVAGTYSVTVTDYNDCTVQATTSIINLAAPIVSNATIIGVSCAGDNNGQILVDVINGSNPIQTNWSNGTNNEDLLNVTAGNYTLSLIDYFGCTTDSTFTITEPLPLSISLNVIDNSPNGVSTITANASGGTQIYQYNWNTGSQAQSITNLSSGVYTITVTDAQDCTTDTSVVIGKELAIINTGFIELLNLYPNPSKHIVNLEIALKNIADIKITVYNTLGQQLYINKTNNILNKTESIDINHFTNGVYYLELEIKQQIEILKFIKIN